MLRAAGQTRAACPAQSPHSVGEGEETMVTYDAIMLDEGDDVQCLEVWQARGELGEELVRRRRADDEDH